ncbi:hypothetical protein J31TS6_11100 [Brevibacillus reuszeri]|nr:hypothetical protein J31TS6_11100 [Brevibacillus reuszeri]
MSAGFQFEGQDVTRGSPLTPKYEVKKDLSVDIITFIQFFGNTINSKNYIFTDNILACFH